MLARLRSGLHWTDSLTAHRVRRFPDMTEPGVLQEGSPSSTARLPPDFPASPSLSTASVLELAALAGIPVDDEAMALRIAVGAGAAVTAVAAARAALQAAGAQVEVIAPAAAGLADVETLEGVRIQRVRYASDTRMTLAYTGNMAEQVMSSWGGKLALLGMLRAMRRAVRERLDAAMARMRFPNADRAIIAMLT